MAWNHHLTSPHHDNLRFLLPLPPPLPLLLPPFLIQPRLVPVAVLTRQRTTAARAVRLLDPVPHARRAGLEDQRGEGLAVAAARVEAEGVAEAFFLLWAVVFLFLCGRGGELIRGDVDFRVDLQACAGVVAVDGDGVRGGGREVVLISVPGGRRVLVYREMGKMGCREGAGRIYQAWLQGSPSRPSMGTATASGARAGLAVAVAVLASSRSSSSPS